ncbi:hypothetical protein [Paraburkholderia hospita]|uniref:hypothetical protein n=1 Tax=Paraburkholderia hospita TaxID=169430 RepID=UPI0009DAE76E|nr:hypothetical protein [Paraburkholderia hospita]OUL80766.1 hypothetical protein CA602_26740 [Paraburkholderia hospita]
MNTRIILSAACAVALSLTSVAHAQGTPAQKNAQPAATTSSTTEYGGVSGTTMAMGNPAHSAWAPPASCGHLARCNPNSGH